ncbi:hypothetical protein FRB96_008312 [Tulasnella sp. 330]|nr:hypothetical protein FRB96_008312 [Tulasnella sp. 330]KAG8886180.1 hypothetical protein FRB97_007218 [Tulasnella sp. 331]KAG8890417.1 hypothetical protein FRB98_008452 [Tulasnella sp. 332]
MSKSLSALPAGKKIVLKAELTAATDEGADTIQKLLTDVTLFSREYEPGTLTYRVSRFGKSFLCFEEYTNAEALKTHAGSEKSKALGKAMGGLLAKPPQILMYSEFAPEGTKAKL